MRKSDTVFLTTIFPECEEYLNDFFSSLLRQTTKQFDVLVINDGIENFRTYRKKYSSLNIIEELVSTTPVKNREHGIKTAIKLGYKFIVFGDSDDYFSENRIEETIVSLKSNHIVFNELTLFNYYNGKKTYVRNQLKNIKSPEDNIFDSNVFGFSNIGLRTEIINHKLIFNDDLIAVDWFFITTLLIQKEYKIHFINNVQTYYRQHGNNIIGMSKLLSEKKLDTGILVKEKHYQGLLIFCKIYHMDKYTNIFEIRLKRIKELRKELSIPSFNKKYIEVVNANINDIFTGWWSEVIFLKEFENYENPIN